MSTPSKTIVGLEKQFWESLVNQDTDAALSMLSEPALMVSTHGAMKLDHQSYRKMAEQGPMVLSSYELNDVDVVFPNDRMAIVTYRVKKQVGQRGKSETIAQEMNDTSTWVQQGTRWKCVMHTETPA